MSHFVTEKTERIEVEYLVLILTECFLCGFSCKRPVVPGKHWRRALSVSPRQRFSLQWAGGDGKAGFPKGARPSAAGPECWSRKALQSLLVKQHLVSPKILTKTPQWVAVCYLFSLEQKSTQSRLVKNKNRLIFYNRAIPMEMSIWTHLHTATFLQSTTST